MKLHTLQPDIEAWNAGLEKLEQALTESGDSESARKLGQVQEKWQTARCQLAFCGHFSAGKSSVINKLCGHPLLPSSPIPTSANLVTIRNGEPEVRIERSAFSETQIVPLQQLETLCRDGETVKSVEIRYPLDWLGNIASFLDTPGVDSTDPAHMEATEAALHLADVIFYVMDYNHVLSEINFTFAKRLQSLGKPLYLIINQIDKHRGHELNFDDFRQSVATRFAEWDITPEGFLYTSVKRPEHPFDEWARLEWLIRQLTDTAPQLIREGTRKSVLQILEEHESWFKGQHREERIRYEQLLEQPEARQALTRMSEIDLERDSLKQAPANWQQSLTDRITRLLNNANIIPAHTRELAKLFLESRQSGFKAGIWFGRRKTEEERQRRLNHLQEELAGNINVHIIKHLTEMLEEEGRQLKAPHERLSEISASLQEIGGRCDETWLLERVKPEPVVSGEYVMNYAKTVSEDAKSAFRREALRWVEYWSELKHSQTRQLMSELDREAESLQGMVEAKEGLQQLDQMESAHSAQLWKIAKLPDNVTISLPDLQEFVSPVRPTSPDENTVTPASPGTMPPAPSTEVALGREARQWMKLSASKLKEASIQLEGLDPMKRTREQMQAKAFRLESNRFTIALFGAFSAGKSSFANALIGEAVLPVSPHPTTAAITALLPTDPRSPHGTLEVRIKPAETIEEDIQIAMSRLGLEAGSTEAALARIHSMNVSDIPAEGRLHYAFLQAVANGWNRMKNALGQTVRTDIGQLPEYASKENVSCFVESLMLYYDTPLSRQGIVVVDTPGADSINARHTGVTFRYMKNADALVFTTYYNHAFSQADRLFLRQLAQVKDSFEMDKMFFVVNAADLSETEEETEQVLRYVESRLRQEEIRTPRIYPVSSIQALDGKLGNDGALTARSGILRFEEELARFTMDEYGKSSMEAARNEIHRAALHLAEWVSEANEAENSRNRKAEEYERRSNEALEAVTRLRSRENGEYISRETEELLYYVKQRIQYNFGDWFQLCYHPSLFADRKITPGKALVSASWELSRLLAEQLEREIQNTTLRLEKSLSSRLNRWSEEARESVRSYLPSFNGGTADDEVWPEWAPDMTWDFEPLSEKEQMSVYKNARHFMEGQGREKLKQDWADRMERPLSHYLDIQGQALTKHYARLIQDILGQRGQKLNDEIKEFTSGVKAALEHHFDIEDLRERQQALERLADF